MRCIGKKILEKYIHPDLVDEFTGDLDELYSERKHRRGKILASFFYLADLLSLIWEFKHTRTHQNKSNMWANYFTTAWRSILKHKTKNAINIFGLTIGLIVFLIIHTYVTYEKSYDDYHLNADRIYRIANHLHTPDKTFHFAITPPWVTHELKNTYPGIESVARFYLNSALVKYEDKSFQEQRMFYTDSTAFDIFDYQLTEGSPNRILREPYTILISESTARKYFGRKSPMGETLVFDRDSSQYEIQGVFADIPSNSYLQFDFLISMTTLEANGTDLNRLWFFFNCYSFMLLKEDADLAYIEEDLPSFTELKAGEAQKRAGQEIDLFVQAFRDVHTKSNLEVEATPPANSSQLNIFALIGLLTIFIACINFINISTARSLDRAKEVGIRKVSGAQKINIVIQFLAESFVIVGLSIALSLGALYLASPHLSRTLNGAFDWYRLMDVDNIKFLLLTTLAVTIFAGTYPSLVLSNFNTVNVLKGKFQRSSRGVLVRKILVSSQLFITIGLIICTLVVNRQLHTLQSAGLGYEPENMLTLNYNFDRNVAGKLEVLKNEFLNHPDVLNVTASRNIPSQDPSNWYASYENNEGEMRNTSLSGYLIDDEFLDTYRIRVEHGRGLDREIASDSSAFLINMSAAKFLGYPNPGDALGKRFAQFRRDGTIVGVISDFNTRSLHFEMDPVAFQLMSPASYTYLSLRVQSDNYQELIRDIEKIWHGALPGRSFDYTFLKDDLRTHYEKEASTVLLFNGFSIISILISFLGLWGLSSFMVEQDKKTISIKKVLGASIPNLVLNYNKSYIPIILISWALAAITSYLVLQNWLDNYPVHVHLNPGFFFVGGAVAFLIVCGTLSYHTNKGARAIPAENLGTE